MLTVKAPAGGVTRDRPLWRRVAPAAALLALAPWTAECSWGGFNVTWFPLVILTLGPLYGGAALLIREVTRRLGGGWPMIVLLAAAFGVYQAGLVDQSVFNPGFLADTELAGQEARAAQTRVPALDVSAQQTFGWIANHIALSICAPIVIVESFLAPRHRREPWLGPFGLAVTVGLLLLGSWLVFSDEEGRKGYLASPLQLTVAAVTVLVLVGLALLPRWRRERAPVPARAPHPIWPGVVVAAAYLTADQLPGWLGLGLQTVAIAAAATLIVVWSRRSGWGQVHALSAWSGALAMAALSAYAIPSYAPAPSPTEALLTDISVSVIVAALVGGALWRLRRTARRAPA